MRIWKVLFAFLIVCATPAMVPAQNASNITFTPVLTGLDEPWAVGFLPDGGYLITLRGGEMRRYGPDGGFVALAGLPDIAMGGQGGLLDVLVPRDFAQTGEVFFTYTRPQGRGAGTALARADLGQTRLENLHILWELTPGSTGDRHFGSRVVEGTDGFLYVTIGDRGNRPTAQDVSNENGSVIRIARDGRVPATNPFVGVAGARPAIWSYGHRNPQGAAFDTSGQLWVIEHGARGGDEVNAIRRGANYGWPVIAYGRHYSGGQIGVGTEAPGMEQPAHYWDPSIAPSGAAFYTGDLFPDWDGDLFVGALSGGIVRLDPNQGMAQVEWISTDATARVRDVRVGPDGALYFLSVGHGALYRMTPAAP